MKLHPTEIQEASKIIIKKAQGGKVYQDTLVYSICKQILSDAEKDAQRGYKKLSLLGTSVETLMQDIANDIAPNQEIQDAGTEIGKLRYDVLFQVLETLPENPSTLQLKTTVKSMFLLSKKFMEKEFEIFPSQI